MLPTVRGSNTGVYVGHSFNKYRFIVTEPHKSQSHGNHRYWTPQFKKKIQQMMK